MPLSILHPLTLSRREPFREVLLASQARAGADGQRLRWIMEMWLSPPALAQPNAKWVEESGRACEDGRILRKGFHAAAEDDDRGLGKRGVGNKTEVAVAGLSELTVDDRGARHDPEGISICRH